MAEETKEYEVDYAQNRDFLKNRNVSKAVCEVEGCSKKAAYGERSEVHGCIDYKRCKRDKEHFIHFTRCKWTFDFLLKLVTFVGAVMTNPETVEAWAFDKVNEKKRISLTCTVHDRQYEQTLSQLARGKHGCGECNGNVPWSQRVPELQDYITGEGYTLDEHPDDLKRGLEKEGKNYKLKLICPEGHAYYSGIVDKFAGKLQRRCSTCAGNLPWSKRVPELMDIITGRDYTRDEPLADLKRGLEKEGKNYKLKLICPEGHAYYSGIVATFTGKEQRGCFTCNGKIPWTERVPELMDIITGRDYTRDEPLADLKRGLEKEGKNYKLKLRCPNGHKYYSGTVDKFTGKEQRGCCKCTDPKTEKLVREWLEEEFSNKFEHKAYPDFLFYPETGRKLELDLFCPELKVAFEIDGRQHNEYCPKYFHRIREKENNTFDNTNPWCSYQIYPGEPQNDRLFIHQQKKDRFIDKRCEEEGIYLIRIDRRYYNHRDPEKLIAHLEEQIKKFMEKCGYKIK